MVASSDMRRIAWSIYWKFFLSSLVGSILAGAILGFVIGFSGALAGFDHSPIMVSVQVVSGPAGLVISFLFFNYFLARSIGRDIGGKRLELVVAEGV